MALIKIIPSPLSRKFDGTVNGMVQYEQTKDTQGVTELRAMGKYNRERFPNSTQGERPIAYSVSKKKYLLEGYDSNNEELNQMVKRCNLMNDLKDHYNYNKPIESCDIFNLKDPFFNHKNVKILFDEGYGSLNTENPLDWILYKGVLSNHRFQIGGENINPALNGRAKYIVVDASIDKQAKKESRNTRKLAEKLVDTMSDDKKRAVALAMGLIINGDTDIDTISDLLEEAALDNKKSVSNNMTKQQYLIKLAEAPNEELEARNYVNLGFKQGFIKRDKETSMFMLFGNQIGKTKQNVINYLLNPVNSETLFRLRKAIDLNEVDG